MKRIIRAAAALALLGGGFGSAGCMNSGRPSVQSKYDNLVDGCYPQRYGLAAREAALAPFEAHVNNGHILDQYVQNGDFELGTDKLTPGGLVKLDSLARKRPVDGHIVLQKTRDVAYDVAKPNDYAKLSGDLDAKRGVAITNYLNATTAGRNLAFDVTVMDPAEQLMPAAGPSNSVRGYAGRFASGIGAIGGSGAVGAGGAASTANVLPGVGGPVLVPGATGPQGGQGGGNPRQ